MFWFKKKKKQSIEQKPLEPITPNESPKAVTIDDFTIEVTDPEEKDLVSVIATCVVAESIPQSKFKITKVSTVDSDKEMAAALVAGILAADHPKSTFKLRKIEEVK